MGVISAAQPRCSLRTLARQAARFTWTAASAAAVSAASATRPLSLASAPARTDSASTRMSAPGLKDAGGLEPRRSMAENGAAANAERPRLRRRDAVKSLEEGGSDLAAPCPPAVKCETSFARGSVMTACRCNCSCRCSTHSVSRRMPGSSLTSSCTERSCQCDVAIWSNPAHSRSQPAEGSLVRHPVTSRRLPPKRSWKA